MGSLHERIHSPFASDTSRPLPFGLYPSEELSAQVHYLPDDLHIGHVSPSLNSKQVKKRKAATITDKDEDTQRKVSIPPAKRETEGFKKRMADAQLRIDSAREESNKLDEEERLAFKIQEIEEAADRLERENEMRRVRLTADHGFFGKVLNLTFEQENIERIYGDFKF
jgi:hypothetical protein